MRAADVGTFIPVEAEPSQVVDHRDFRRARRSLDVGVLDAQHERASGTASEQPVEDRGPHVADVQLAGRTWREADSHSPLPTAIARTAIPTPRPSSPTPS